MWRPRTAGAVQVRALKAPQSSGRFKSEDEKASLYEIRDKKTRTSVTGSAELLRSSTSAAWPRSSGGSPASRPGSSPCGSLCISANHADILTACCLSSRRKRSFRSPRASHSAKETAATVPTEATQVETVPHCTALILPSWGMAPTVRQGPTAPKTGPLTQAFQLDSHARCVCCKPVNGGRPDRSDHSAITRDNDCSVR